MYTVTKTYTRPDANVPFFFEISKLSPEAEDYIAKHYPTTLLKATRTISEDKLTLTAVTVWSSREDLLKFITDPYCHQEAVAPAARYDAKNNIINTSTIVKKDN